MRRPHILAVPVLCALAFMVMARGASADPNPNSGRVPLEIPPDQTVTGVCQFPVGIHVDINKEFSKEHKNGVTIITGRLVVTLTNTETGQSVTYNISGPVHITSQDGLETDVFLGRSLLFNPDIGMLVTSGRAVTSFDPDTGVFTLVSYRGHAEDLCAALAPRLPDSWVRTGPSFVLGEGPVSSRTSTLFAAPGAGAALQHARGGRMRKPLLWGIAAGAVGTIALDVVSYRSSARGLQPSGGR
jgi:hypothetical protein